MAIAVTDTSDDACALPRPGADQGPPHLGELEARCMQVLWELRRPAVVREVLENVSGDLAYTTVATVLGNLVKKNMVIRHRRARSWAYEPQMTRCSYAADLMTQALSVTDNRANCFSRFLTGLSTADRAMLRQLLDDEA